MKKITIVCIFLFFTITGILAQQTCYQIGLNEGREIYNEAQRLERSGRCVDAVPQYWEALRRFRLTRSCRDLPSNHELGVWEDRCINGITTCGGKYDETTVLSVSSRILRFNEAGGEISITVNTNANVWRVDRNPSWVTARRNNNRLTVTCTANTGPNSRSERLIVVANTLTYEVTIEQAGKTSVTQSPAESIKITGVKFAGVYADGTSGDYGEALFNHMTLLRPQIACDYLTSDSKPIKLDFKIIDPAGKILSDSDLDYTYSAEIISQGNVQNAVFDVSGWDGAGNDTPFITTGNYSFEIWLSGVNIFTSSFEVASKQVLPCEGIQISDVRFAGKYADGTSDNYGEKIYKNLISIHPQVTCVNLTEDSKMLDLHFSILHTDGRQLFPKDGNEWHIEMNMFGNIQQINTFDTPAGIFGSGTPFEEAGTYRFEIVCSGVHIFTTTFEVLTPQPRLRPTSPASTSAKLNTSVGIKAGLNLATINNRMNSISFSPEIKPDFHAGLYVDLSLGNKGFFSLQPEAQYSRQGFADRGEAVNFDYVVGFLMLKLHVYQGLHIEVGPYASYLLSVSPSSTIISEKQIKLSDLKGGKDVGAAIGIGYDFNVGLVAGARYLYGLSDVANNLLWTNHVVAVSLGWRF